MESILATAKKVAEEAEVFMVSSESTPVEFEANHLKHIRSQRSTMVALRIIRQGRIGYAVATALDDEQNLVDMAVETARFGMTARFEFPSPESYPRIELFDSAVESVPLEQMIHLGQGLIDTVTGHTPDIVCEGGVSRDVVSISIMNSRGGKTSYKISVFALGVEGSLIRGTDMLFVGDTMSSCHLILDTREVADVVLWQLEMAKDIAQIRSGELPVVFTPRGSASALLAPLMAAFNGKLVLEGASPIGNRRGEQVFDTKLSLWDDATIPYRPRSRPCDDEGVPSQRTPLIEQGVVASFLYDLQTAALAGTRSTGNGARSRGGLPSPSPSAFIIGTGNASFDEMVQDMKEGLVIEQLMGAEQGNVLGGDFSGNVLLGYKVERGKIVGRVKNTMVSGNVYQLLKEITAIGGEARWVGDSICVPSIYCPRISVAAKD